MAERVFADVAGLRAACARISACTFGENEWFTPAELAATTPTKYEKRRRERLAARFVLKSLALELGVAESPLELEVAAEENGRPFLLVRGGRSVFDVSFSHSGDFTACVIATEPDARLGIDIQTPDDRLGGLTRKFVAPGDNAFVDAGFKNPLLMLWTLKEAASKCTGGGLSAGFEKLVCTPCETDCAASRARCDIAGPCGFKGVGYVEPCPLQSDVLLALSVRIRGIS